MARSRNIKPGFFQNEELVELPFHTRLLFIGLWTLCDRAGRMEDRPKRIKMALFPADDIDVNESLDALQASGFLLRYEHDGSQYIQVISFEKHQNPHKDERASNIPPPCGHGAPMVQPPSEQHANRADSLLLIPDSQIPDPSTLGDETPDEFEQAWSAYPKRHGANPKRDALHAWSARRKEGVPAQDMIDGVHRYARHLIASGKAGTEYVMQAKRFFGPNRLFGEPWEARAPTAPPSRQQQLEANNRAAVESARKLIFGEEE